MQKRHSPNKNFRDTKALKINCPRLFDALAASPVPYPVAVINPSQERLRINCGFSLAYRPTWRRGFVSSKRSKVKEIIVLIKARSFLDELNLEHLTS